MDRALVALLLLLSVAAAAAADRARRGAGSAPAAGGPARVDPDELGLGGGRLGVVGFSSPHCLPCQAWEAALGERGVPWSKVDVARRADLARRYGVRETPLVLAVELPEGRVVEAFAGEPEQHQVERLAALARS